MVDHPYKLVQWTPFKKKYDLILLVSIILYIIVFIAVSLTLSPSDPKLALHPVQIVMRALGTLAFVMLTVLLMIGPLARLSSRFLSLLYNRRHLGVATFIVGLLHAFVALMWYHGFSELNPLVSLFISNPNYTKLGGFPFEVLGFAALVILLMMAATSHDFWNTNLGPRLWKALHMLVYIAYFLLIAHIILGVVQYEKSLAYGLLVVVSLLLVVPLHVIAAFTEAGAKAARNEEDDWICIGRPSILRDGQAVIVEIAHDERVAIFRQGNLVGAISNLCRHQNGPLGEGKIVDCLVTCPWHGFQYRLQDGRSPAPFNEMIPTYVMELREGEMFLNPVPLPAGTERPLLDLPATLFSVEA